MDTFRFIDSMLTGLSQVNASARACFEQPRRSPQSCGGWSRRDIPYNNNPSYGYGCAYGVPNSYRVNPPVQTYPRYEGFTSDAYGCGNGGSNPYVSNNYPYYRGGLIR